LCGRGRRLYILRVIPLEDEGARSQSKTTGALREL
jgi:hypothetical protein